MPPMMAARRARRGAATRLSVIAAADELACQMLGGLKNMGCTVWPQPAHARLHPPPPLATLATLQQHTACM